MLLFFCFVDPSFSFSPQTHTHTHTNNCLLSNIHLTTRLTHTERTGMHARITGCKSCTIPRKSSPIKCCMPKWGFCNGRYTLHRCPRIGSQQLYFVQQSFGGPYQTGSIRVGPSRCDQGKRAVPTMGQSVFSSRRCIAMSRPIW